MVKTEKIPEGYRATETGILPVDWQVKRLSEVATELTERAGQDKYETVSISAGIGFVNQAEKFGKELSGKQYEKYIVLHQGDFSYNKGNSKTSPQGCIYCLNDRETAAVPNVFESFRVEGQNAGYYEQLFLSGFLNKQLYSKINRGVRDDGLLNLTGKDFYSCTVPVPPIAEQKKIAEVLSCCDRVIELKQQLIIELQQLKNGFLQAMFPAKGHSEPDIRFPEFSDAWEQRKFGNDNNLITGYPFESENFSEDGIKLVRGMNVKRGYLDFSDDICMRWNSSDGLENYLLEDEDILIQMDGALIGKSYAKIAKEQLPALLVQRVTRARAKAKIACADFMYQTIQRDFLKYIGINKTETAVPHLSLNDIKNFEIMVPSLEEQQKIGAYFSNLDHLITLHQQELEETKKKKKSLAKLLLTGSVRVPT